MSLPTRAERRQASKGLRRALRKIERANQRFDPTAPLVFEDGWTHRVCGGAARMGNQPFTAECLSCGRMVPVEELTRAGLAG